MTKYDKMVDLVWNRLKRDHGHKNRRQTAWGTKTKIGLAACFKSFYDTPLTTEEIEGVE